MTGYGSLPPVTNPTLTLVEGTCFAISPTAGDMRAGNLDGLYFRDTRIVSHWQLSLDGRPVDALSAQPQTPYDALFLGRRYGGEGSTLLVQRHRMVGDGMREDLVLRNLGSEDTACRIDLRVDADFADLFSVRGGSPSPLGEVSWTYGSGTLRAEARDGRRQRGVRIRLDGARAE
ncbi:MAG TPA: glycogen debranching N-terminal domain-containing protein, partial [Actinopolymorphaceae bacterium]